jgi:membrane protease YdiL (CAAX protease family)
MKGAFVNPSDGRLRAGWRILIFVVSFLGLSVAGQFALKAALGGIPKEAFLRNSAVILLAAAAATIAVPLARRLLDRKSFVSLGLRVDRRTFADLGFGFLLSGAMAASIFAVMTWTGLIEVTGIRWGGEAAGESFASLASYMAVVGFGSLAVLLLVDVVVGWWEELVFRGYLLQNMTEGMGLTWAVGVSCVLYGLVHAANPNAGLLSTAIIVLFGFLRIYGYLATGLLWLSMGMHIGWNFFQGPVFGFAASGHQAASLVSQHTTGPSWLTGHAFGPEGSVITIPVVVLALIAMRWWAGPTATRSRGFVVHAEPIARGRSASIDRPSSVGRCNAVSKVAR